MNAKPIAITALILLLLLGAETASFSQTGGEPLPPADTLPGQLLPISSATPSTPEMEAERAKIWNSPAMLRARAWAQEYCQRSAKITPQEAQDYMTELQQMTPTQMKLWLLKFNHEEEMIQQRQAAFEQSRQASVQQALGMHRSVQQAYDRIDQDETAAAQTAEQSLNQGQQNAEHNAAENFAVKEAGLAAEGTIGLGGLGYGLGPYSYAYPPFSDVPFAPIHYHYHFH